MTHDKSIIGTNNCSKAHVCNNTFGYIFIELCRRRRGLIKLDGRPPVHCHTCILRAWNKTVIMVDGDSQPVIKYRTTIVLHVLYYIIDIDLGVGGKKNGRCERGDFQFSDKRLENKSRTFFFCHAPLCVIRERGVKVDAQIIYFSCQKMTTFILEPCEGCADKALCSLCEDKALLKKKILSALRKFYIQTYLTNNNVEFLTRHYFQTR